MEHRTPRSGQLHHYLPRFVARGWLQEVKKVTSVGKKSNGGRNKGRQRPQEYKQELINSYDIQSDELHLGTTDLGKTFGIVDMYKDHDADLTDAYRVEKAFAKLEGDVARIFRVLEAAEHRGRSSVELVRSDLNILRKFLFLTFYRNGNHSRQFIENHFDPNTAKMVEEYRVQNGLADSRAVWLRQLSLLLEDEHWEVAHDERLLWTARVDYKYDAWDMKTGFYRAPPDTEFILTEDGLGLGEGRATPMHAMHDMLSPGAPSPSYVVLTQTFPITPKLVIILRSKLMGFYTSFFHDIAQTPSKTTYIPPLPRNSYDWVKSRDEMTAEDLKEEEDFSERGLLNGQFLHSRLKDRFDFAIDTLTVDQAQRVNTLLLTHCRETISFRTPACLLRSIAAFEKDRQLTTERKDRYASLKAKLAAIQVPSPSTPVPTSAPPGSPGMSMSPSPPPPQPVSTSPDHPSASRHQDPETLPLEMSMPGLRGAFKKQKARAVPTPDSPNTSVSEPLSLPVVVPSEQGHSGETTTGPPLSGVSSPPVPIPDSPDTSVSEHLFLPVPSEQDHYTTEPPHSEVSSSLSAAGAQTMLTNVVEPLIVCLIACLILYFFPLSSLRAYFSGY